MRMMTTPDTTSSTANSLLLLGKLIIIDAYLKGADPWSVRWLYDRYNGLEQFAEALETAQGMEGLIRFFENEPGILAEMERDALEADG